MCEKLINHLRYCATDETDCLGCERYDYDCGSSKCVDDLMNKAAEMLEQLWAHNDELECERQAWLHDQEKFRWVPVSERLPEQGQEVIIYTGNILKPTVLAYQFWNPKYDTWAHVTHWMPLPEPPK